MKKLSTGEDSTLGNWITLSSVFFGAESAPTKFLKKEAEESPNGLNEPVIADEGQLLSVLVKMLKDELTPEEKDKDNV